MVAEKQRDMTGRTVLVTGATDGLGRALARELAATGARVLIHGRDPQRLAETEAEIRAATGSEHLRTLRADFASLEQVDALADDVLLDEPRLDVLVSNAGIGTELPGGGLRVESEDDLELRFAVNYLAGYLLSSRLLGLMSSVGAARVVNVASAGQMPFDFDDVMLMRGYSGVQAYCQSKLGQIMQTFDQAESEEPSAVSINALHPATYMPTKMVLAAGATPASRLEQGVEATLRLVLDPELDDVSGRYFNGLQEQDAHPQAYDRAARGRLRELSERLVGEILDQR